MDNVLSDVREKAKGYGIEVERVEVQHVHLPPEIQQAINETRTAFLAPIRSEREAEAVRIKLQKFASVLRSENVAMNMLLDNFRNANFVTPMNFMQSIFWKP